MAVWRLALVSALAGSILLAGCGPIPQDAGRAGGRDPRGGLDRGGEPPSARSCNPRRLIGVLVVFSNVVLLNNQQARTGQLVCDGDAVSTNASGTADVIPEQDRESDSIHLAESTDPRFSWLPGSGCLQIDRYVQGKIVTTTRRLCMVVRTADTLILQTTGRTQFTVLRATARTEVVPVSGLAIKLKQLPEAQIPSLTRTTLQAARAEPAAQPQLRHLNIYSRHTVLQKIRLAPRDIETIERSPLRAPGPTPAPAPR